jgi:phage terminase large subunit
LVEPDPILEDAKLPTNTIDEIPGYAWSKTPDGKPNKEQPIKMNDHGCDVFRYMVMHVDNDTVWSRGRGK